MLRTALVVSVVMSFLLVDTEANETGATDALGYEELLVLDLLKRSSLTVRPNACAVHCADPVLVNITYNVIQILGFVWRDHRLIWDHSRYGNVSQVSLASKFLWLPDVGVMNGKSSKDFDFSAKSQSRLNVDRHGSITWLHGAILDVTCPLDVSLFPFDRQTCYLILTPWQSPIDHVLIKPVQHGSAVDNSYLPNSNVSEWEIIEVRFDWKNYISQLNVSYQYISISIELQRSPLYFIVLVLVPFSMLSCLACLIFTLEDTGDRLSVALSLVLSMTMYVVIVSSNAPRSMRTLPVLGIYLLDQLGLLSVATILAVINNKLRKYRVTRPRQKDSSNFRCPDTMDESPILELRKFTNHSHPPHQCHRQGTPSSRHHHSNHHNYSHNNSSTIRANYRNNSPSPEATSLASSSRSFSTGSFAGLHQQPEDYIPLETNHHKSARRPSSLRRSSKLKTNLYRHLAFKLDQVELVLYLVLSGVNAVVCLIIMPRMNQRIPGSGILKD